MMIVMSDVMAVIVEFDLKHSLHCTIVQKTLFLALTFSPSWSTKLFFFLCPRRGEKKEFERKKKKHKTQKEGTRPFQPL